MILNNNDKSDASYKEIKGNTQGRSINKYRQRNDILKKERKKERKYVSKTRAMIIILMKNENRKK